MEEQFKPSKRLKNELYLKLLNGDFVPLVYKDELRHVIDNIIRTERHKREAATLLLFLYYTGARPAEILDLKRENLYREGQFIYIRLRTKKRGKSRTLSISMRQQWMKEVYDYLQRIYFTEYLFPHFRCSYVREKKNKDGTVRKIPEVSATLRYHFKKWFTNRPIIPYFLRHNRFSIMLERGASYEEVKEAKGARSLSSVDPYTHFSKKSAKKFSRYH